MIRLGSLAVGILALASSLAAAAAPSDSCDWAKKSEGRFAYSVFFGGKKVGWIIEETKLGTHAGKPVLQSISEEYTETRLRRREVGQEERSMTSYELTGEGPIVHLRAEAQRGRQGDAPRRRARRREAPHHDASAETAR